MSQCPVTGAISKIPKLKGSLLLGNTRQVLADPWRFVRNAYRGLGNAFSFTFLGTEVLVLSGEKTRKLFTDAGDNFLDRAFFYQPMVDQLGCDELIFTSKGERHQDHRRISSLAFSRHLCARHIAEIAEVFVDRFEDLEKGKAYDAVNLSSEILIAGSGPMMGNCDLRGYEKDIAYYVCTIMQVAGRTKTKLSTWTKRYKRTQDFSIQFGLDLLKKWRAGEIAHKEKPYTIGVLADGKDRHGKPLADSDINALNLATLIGSGVYINRLVALMLHQLAQDPNLLERLRVETDRAFEHGYSYEAICELEDLRAFYNETLRMYPIWFVVPFRALEPFVFDGKQIRKGQILFISPTQEHWDSKYYNDPGVFDIDRCKPPRDEHRQPWAFNPFGVGKRRCVATGITELMTLLYVGIFIHRTHFESDPNYKLRYRMDPLPAPKGFMQTFRGMRTVDIKPPLKDKPELVEADLDRFVERLGWEEVEQLITVIEEQLEVEHFAAGHEVFHQGDDGDAFYVIESGLLDVLKDTEAGTPEKMATLGPGDLFGQVALLQNKRRNATVKVGEKPLAALRLDRQVFEKLLGEINLTAKELIAFIRAHKVKKLLAEMVPEMDEDTMSQLAVSAERRTGVAGEVFVKQGSPANYFYIITKGRFDVFSERSKGVHVYMTTLKAGQFFGETGLLRGVPRTATVRVSDDCPEAEVVKLDRDGFFNLIHSKSQFHQALYQRVATSEGPVSPG